MKTLPPCPPRFNTVTEALAHAHSGQGLIFLDGDEKETRLSWSDLLVQARKVAAGLMELGIGPGDRVALVLPTGIRFVEAFFGILWAGAVPVPLYPPVRLGRMDEYHRSTAQMLSLAGVRLVLTGGASMLMLGQALEMARPALGFQTVESLLERGSLESVSRDLNPESLGLVQFSSGSTLEPKPVALTHRQLMAQCALLHGLMPPRGDDLGVSWLPLYHDMGLIGCLLSAVYYPGPLVLIPPELFLARPAIWLRAISRYKATVSPAPNFAFGLCLKRVRDEDLEGLDLSSWRYALNGAEPVSANVLCRFAEKFESRGFDKSSLLPVYGLSEAALAVTFSPRRWPQRKASVDGAHLAKTGEVRAGTREILSVGTPVPGFEVEVRSPLGLSVREGQVGRVFVRGPSVMQGYLGLPEQTADVLVDGWLDTGDLGFVLEGELHISGRAKDTVIIRGANHAPQEFEEVIDSLPGVRTGCSVAGGILPEGHEGEALLMLVEVTPEASPSLSQEIQTTVLRKTGIRPHTVELLRPGTLPRTSSGKLRRGEAIRRFLAKELMPPKSVGALSMSGEVAKSVIAMTRTFLEKE
jgi:fatty-acyl-CoA synthase